MQIGETVHLICNEFWVTPEIKRYVNIYLITGKSCYLIDSGVVGAQEIISAYMKSIGRDINEIRGLFLTHSHPDHIGSAAEIQRISNCKVYAPADEIEWIENINLQYEQRPIPNFFKLVSEPVTVSDRLNEGTVIKLEDDIEIQSLYTKGHSHGSMSYILNGETVFTGDAIPCENDIPIFVNYEQSIESINKLRNIKRINFCCPAWDDVYDKEKFNSATEKAISILKRLKSAVISTESKFPEITEEDKIKNICQIMQMPVFSGNPLFAKSVEACKSSYKF